MSSHNLRTDTESSSGPFRSCALCNQLYPQSVLIPLGAFAVCGIGLIEHFLCAGCAHTIGNKLCLYETTLETNEFYLLQNLLNLHIIQARKQCEELRQPYHGGIAFDEQLHKKLIPFLHHQVTLIRGDRERHEEMGHD